ncbi:transglycosylase domain-containing protein [Paenibacillus chartarius]|uniref:Transglycosylase domain-containing protein n=1 Tax=Paenibacillus chartarius TaxID=747481 RepID=A0ABV6DN81_9BACL
MTAWKINRIGKIAAWSAGACALGIASACIAGYVYIRSLDVSTLDQPLPEPTLVLDRYGKTVSQLSASRIEPVSIAQLPKPLVDAVLAVEDQRYFEHTGVDLRAIARALVRDVMRGGYSEGGSTITQQLARHAFLGADKTLMRKLREAAYAIKIDMTYDKIEVLELYLNSIYFGEGSWGIQSAAKVYFGKPAKELTLPEAAMLAALPKAPSRYSPLQNEAQALERRNTVLALMREQDRISAAEYERASAAPSGVVREPRSDNPQGRYPAYVDAVLAEAIERYGFSEEQLLTGGLRITTELDPKIQDAVLDVYRTDSLFPPGKPDQLLQSGAVVLDHRFGAVRAVAGGRGQQVFRGFSRATQLKRQPGSAFKPIAVYGPALEKGYTPESLLYDGPLDIGGYRPQDWDHGSRGQVTMREAVVSSWNVPAVWLLHEIGIDSGLSFAKRLGIPLPKQDRQLGIALGGLSEGVSPLQMAQAYGAFAAGGVLVQAHTIANIKTKDGHLLVKANVQGQAVMKPRTAASITSMLQEAVTRGTGRNAAMNRPAAGKSGTTQLPDTPEFQGLDGNAAKDAWFVGYTAELTAAIWLGYDRTDRNHYLTTSGGHVPAILFREIMLRAAES